jgi:AraC-like DNA-binding protein
MTRLPQWSTMRQTSVEGVECFSAHFVSHVFDRHSHETFAIGSTFKGVQSFHCRGARRNSMEGHIMLFNPDDAHDGWAGVSDGFAYRMLYITADGMSQLLDEADAGLSIRGGGGLKLSGGLFREPLVQDRRLAGLFGAATENLLVPSNSLQAAECLSSVLTDVFQRYAGGREAAVRAAGRSARITRVRDLLESRYGEDVTIGVVADVAGMSRVHATRQFTLAYGMPPHAYLNQVRIRHAKRLLLEGVAAAEVALEVGFVDQSHFSRRFKRSVGVPPAAWVQSMGRVAGC